MSTIKQYISDNFDIDTITDIIKHGCSGGINGLIYYDETSAFHDEYESEIWDMLYEDALDQDLTVMELIASFQGQKNIGSMEQFKNLLCWYAVERTCNEIYNNIAA